MKKIKLSKKNYFVIAISFIILLAVFGTFAWWQWSSQINALIYGEVCAPEIVFMGGTTINGSDLLPVLTKEEGLTKDIYINLNNTCANDTAVLNLNLNLELFPSGLADSSFKWALYEVEFSSVGGTPTETLTYVNNGNFANKVQNNTISLATDLLVTENVSTYRLFIWLDANMDNPSTVGDNVFRFKLYGTGSGAIYRNYTMSQQAPGVNSATATSLFWGSSINRNQVKSITFTKLIDKPQVVSGEKDISSVAGSDSVIMWWIENGQTTDATPITLYDVYVGSNNGVVKSNTSGYNMFANLINCEYMDLEGLDTSNMTTMKYMFVDNGKVRTIKLSNWDTSRVTNMENMFRNCSSLINMDVGNFNTTRVTDFSGMFWACSKLEVINVSRFNTSNATDMGGMFNGCSKVKVLDVSRFNTSKVTVISELFAGCSSLKELNLSSFNTERITSLRKTFSGCSNLVSLDLSSFVIPSLNDFYEIFRSDNKLNYINLSNLDFSGITSTTRSFANVPTTAEIIVKNCEQYNIFKTKFETGFTNLHTINNETCTV